MQLLKNSLTLTILKFVIIFYLNFKEFTIKGFILKIQKAKNEDIIVTILSEKRVERYYRFYGARHSILQLGYLIDFEVKESGIFLPQVRNITHIGFNWLYNREKLMLWHRLITVIEPHFKDVGEINPFYFNKLIESAKKWEKQSVKRLTVETIFDILKYEGRIHPLFKCAICNKKIEKNISVIEGFLPVHSSCINQEALNFKALYNLFKTSSTILLDDNSVEKLYQIALKSI